MAVIHDSLKEAKRMYANLVSMKTKYGADPDVIDAIRCCACVIKALQDKINKLQKREDERCKRPLEWQESVH